MRKGQLILQLIPPTSHHDPLRILTVDQLNDLSGEELVRQALNLMTIDDPHGNKRTACVLIEQCIIELASNATDSTVQTSQESQARSSSSCKS